MSNSQIPHNKLIYFWLLTCIILVFFMIILGGYTRLTHSGLSIVEWKPITGTLPPLTELDWHDEFSKYKQSPEYKKVNNHMNLDDFKGIFFIEYFHRLLGRIIGLVFFLPFLYFLFSKKLANNDIKDFALILILIGGQGAIGWFMVKSGLLDQPNVSQYRLAIHLLMACLILILLALKLIGIKEKISKYQFFTLGLLLLQITSGAFVAGLKAGLIYNSFPLMNNEIIPEGLFFLKPWYINFFENITTVQFIHRILGTINLLNIIYYSFKTKGNIAMLLIGIVAAQFILGIMTLLLQVPLVLGLAHQAVAIILLITLVFSFKKNRIKL